MLNNIAPHVYEGPDKVLRIPLRLGGAGPPNLIVEMMQTPHPSPTRGIIVRENGWLRVLLLRTEVERPPEHRLGTRFASDW